VQRDIWDLLSPSLTCLVGELCGQQVPAASYATHHTLYTFPVAAAQVWNSLPEAVVSTSSLQTFRRHLKTHFFDYHTSSDF